MRLLLPFAVSLLFASVVSAAAQTTASCDCTALKLIPISGHVLDAITGKPIAGAAVHYFDSNPPLEASGARIRIPLSGEVRADADGTYHLPSDLPLSSFHVRASAPGYFAAAFYDEPAIVGHKVPVGFPQPPSHDLRLQPSHDLLAIGSSRLQSSPSPSGFMGSITAATFSTDRQSLLLALQGPALQLVSLPSGDLHPIALPTELTPALPVQQLGFDGKNLLFAAGSGNTSFVGGATAPDFQVHLLPTPQAPFTTVTIGPFRGEPSRFTLQQTSSCDEGEPTPHCGQSGSLVVHDTKTNRTTTLKSDSASDLDYLFQPLLNNVVFAESRAVRVPVPVPKEVEKSGYVLNIREFAGLTLLDLVTHQRSRLELPGDGSRTLHLLAEEPVAGDGRLAGMRVAYTVDGDCDPNSTDATQPFASSGPVGVTPNQWSVCVVTIPMPAAPTPKAKLPHQ